MQFPAIVTASSIVVFLFYYIVFYLIVRRFNTNKNHALFIELAFHLKIWVTPIYLFYHKYIQKLGDVFGYHTEAIFLKDRPLGEYLKFLFASKEGFMNSSIDLIQHNVFVDNDELFVVKMGSITHFFTFDTLLGTSLIFSFAAFIGTCLLYITFYKLCQSCNKWLAILVLLSPSTLFWSVAINKDSISIFALGLLAYGLFEMVYQKKYNLKTKGAILFGVLIFVNVKVYILLSFIIAAALLIILLKLSKLKTYIAKFIIGIVVLGSLAMIVITLNSVGGEDNILTFKGLMNRMLVNYLYLSKNAGAGSAYDLGELTADAFSMVNVIPDAIIVSLFRPFPWEIRNMAMLVSALESMFTVLLTLFVIIQSRVIGFLIQLIKNKMVFFCIVFSLTFAFFVGVTSGNFGTLVRYKIPLLPFYYFGLILVLKRKKESNSTSNIQFT